MASGKTARSLLGSPPTRGAVQPTQHRPAQRICGARAPNTRLPELNLDFGQLRKACHRRPAARRTGRTLRRRRRDRWRTFVAYVEQQLAPALRPGDVVVIGNLSSHKVQAFGSNRGEGRRGAVSAALQPRPEPDRDGICQAEIVAARQGPAHYGGAMERVGPISNAFSQTECSNYFRHAGSRQSA